MAGCIINYLCNVFGLLGSLGWLGRPMVGETSACHREIVVNMLMAAPVSPISQLWYAFSSTSLLSQLQCSTG